MDKLTPMLAQYRAIKREHEDVILLFRLGDFYEMFGEDAKLASDLLDLVLTSRELGKGRRLPMCGIPYHAVDRYLARLLAAGHKAAICEQVEDARAAKGLVKREVIRILTPGTVVEDHLLESNANNYLVALAQNQQRFGLAVVDSSTGDMAVTEFQGPNALSDLAEELARLDPAEALIPENRDLPPSLAGRAAITPYNEELFLPDMPEDILKKHFETASLRGFGCAEMPAAITAAAVAISYLKHTQLSSLAQLRELHAYHRDQFAIIDSTTRRNLELLASLRDGTRQHTLIWVLDDTRTPMGARLLRRWITTPLLDVKHIEERLDAVQCFLEDATLRLRLQKELRRVRDLERPVARASVGAASPRDLAGLRDSLARLPDLVSLVSESGKVALQKLVADFDCLPDLHQLLDRALEQAPPATTREGGIIREGFSAELDELRSLRADGRGWIADLEAHEREVTGIKSLKVGFNQVFGYYIEVTRPNLSLVPEHYQRRQTMRNAERFITPELKEYESKVLGAEERILTLEQDLFAELRNNVSAHASRVQASADIIACLDVLSSFAEVAARNRYVRPDINTDDVIRLQAARHPVVELSLQEERFIPNDVELDCSENQLLIITGPNMAGKSTYLRQVALIVLMAQIGSFVPAEQASIGLVDRIFSRVGASDDLATGQSTFMVEMTETANILRHATEKSLIILDEIGRGTSTFDGLSIAWSVAEYIHNSPKLGAKTLFATHYHHLNELAGLLPRVKNFRIGVKERDDQIVFLRQIIPGGTDRSYGIQVARLAGLPPEVIERAKQVLWSLEKDNHLSPTPSTPRSPAAAPSKDQLSLFEGAQDPLVVELSNLDIDNLSPLEALNKLAELHRKAHEQGKSTSPESKEE